MKRIALVKKLMGIRLNGSLLSVRPNLDDMDFTETEQYILTNIANGSGIDEEVREFGIEVIDALAEKLFAEGSRLRTAVSSHHIIDNEEPMARPLLDDELWGLIEPLLPPPKPRRAKFPGRKPLDRRKVLTGIPRGLM